LVGYTNAGKSTLLNRLSNSDVYVADQLFATLDPTTRRVELPGGRRALLTDTVGFIQKLPTMLIAAFRATLEEIAEADLLLHIVDITHPNAKAQAASVLDTLSEIEANHIPLLTVINKIDLFDGLEDVQLSRSLFPDCVAISALKQQDFSELLQVINQKLYEMDTFISVRLPYDEGALIALFHEQGQVERVEHTRTGVLIEGRLPGRWVARYKLFENTDEVEAISGE
jgi:GTP-binding protein HflX